MWPMNVYININFFIFTIHCFSALDKFEEGFEAHNILKHKKTHHTSIFHFNRLSIYSNGQFNPLLYMASVFNYF